MLDTAWLCTGRGAAHDNEHGQHQITPEARHGEALGLRLMVINASSVAMPVLFGSAGAVAGVTAVFWVTAAAVGLGARAAWRLRVGKTP